MHVNSWQYPDVGQSILSPLVDIYAFPRVAILPGHEQKVFVPNTTLFTRGLDDAEKAAASRHVLIHGTIQSVGKSSARYIPFVTSPRGDITEGPVQELGFDYCIYALGAKYPTPINVWTRQETIESHQPSHPPHPQAHEINATPRAVSSSNGVVETTDSTGTKPEGVKWMQASQERIKDAKSVLVVGGGALGVRECLVSATTTLSCTPTFVAIQSWCLPIKQKSQRIS